MSMMHEWNNMSFSELWSPSVILITIILTALYLYIMQIKKSSFFEISLFFPTTCYIPLTWRHPNFFGFFPKKMISSLGEIIMKIMQEGVQIIALAWIFKQWYRFENKIMKLNTFNRTN